MPVTFNVGDIGLGTNIPHNKQHDSESNFSFLKIGIEDQCTNLGISFTPLKFFSWNDRSRDTSSEDPSQSYLSLLARLYTGI